MADPRRKTIFPGCDQWIPTEHYKDNALATKRKDDHPLTEVKKPSSVLLPPQLLGSDLKVSKVLIKPSPSIANPVPVRQESPWAHYKKGYKLDLGGSVAVVRTIPTSTKLFTIRSFSNDAERKLYMLYQFQHKNVLAAHETFFFEDAFYIISEYAEISCNELIIARPNEIQLATIISQALAGVNYLNSQKLTHGTINSSNILLTREGVVKIANLENCRITTAQSRHDDVKALGQVMKQLMELGSENGRLGLQQPEKWSLDAVNFLSLTMTVSPSELQEHAFLDSSTHAGELVLLISLGIRSAAWFYSVSSNT